MSEKHFHDEDTKGIKCNDRVGTIRTKPLSRLLYVPLRLPQKTKNFPNAMNATVREGIEDSRAIYPSPSCLRG